MLKRGRIFDVLRERGTDVPIGNSLANCFDSVEFLESARRLIQVGGNSTLKTG